MSTPSELSLKGVVPRTSLRKGTHSCQECRIRKTRCVPRPGKILTCVECFSRGVGCRSQDGPLPQLSDGPTLRDRIARLEKEVKDLQSERFASGNSKQVREKDVARTPQSNLKSQTFPPSPASSDVPIISCNHLDDPPLFSLFDNAVLRRSVLVKNDLKQSRMQSLSGDSLSSLRQTEVRRALLSPLPSPKDLAIILEASQPIWGVWRRMFPEIDTHKSHDSLKQFTFWCLGQESPVHIAMAMLCVAVSLQHIDTNISQLYLNLPLPPKDLIKHYFELVDRLIIANIEYAATLEGVNVVVFRAKCHFNLGQPLQCWLLFRQAISIAQLLGLTKSEKLYPDESEASIENRLRAWWLRYQYDRYTSLLLGLPYAVAGDGNHTRRQELTSSLENPSDILYRKLYAVAGRIIDRNQASMALSMSLTLEIDQDLEDVMKLIPKSWWDIHSARASGAINMGEYFIRLMAQFWYYQIKIFLHLPFMLEFSTDRAFEYTNNSCFGATRNLLGLYHIMRSQDDQIGFNMCEVIDFQGFTAAVLLVLAILGYGRYTSVQDAESYDADCRLVEITKATIRRISAEEGHTIARQSLEVLEALDLVGHGNGPEDTSQAFHWERKIAIPCFGTITITKGSISSKSTLEAVPPSNEAEEGRDTPIVMQSDYDRDFDLNKSFPHIEIDWQNMVNGDLDGDWGWNLNETST